MKELTKLEEEIMQVMWKIGKGFANEIMAAIPEPKPAYNTVLTIVRILEKKGFVGYDAYGKAHQYYPLISKEDYSKQILTGVVKNYFNNSFRNLVSAFADGKNLTLKDLEELKNIINE
ncbi:MAG: BlaI/MecI/CopY family transcriptional regulator [Bacteroidetes bacterium]|nr:BlaI/MecI/CopY family transcriptional regulator [Bacteroidota bacterium]MCL1968155.1 BlaI/MecI/CopY family transcriptional regulator [Bacteroidota bacterium]